MALSHNLEARRTGIFLSVDKRVQADPVTRDLHALQEYASHPMLVPCIVFSATLRLAVQRRHSIKAKVDKLEKALARIAAKPWAVDVEEKEKGDIESLFELLNSCRRDQASRKGRYDFWDSYFQGIEKGFEYSEHFVRSCENEKGFKAHTELKHWAALIWQRLRSLNERDKDHVERVAGHSHTVSSSLILSREGQTNLWVLFQVYNLVQQRDMRLQSSIARASQRDSEDMKFIAVLGSVFLPASLVAVRYRRGRQSGGFD